MLEKENTGKTKMLKIGRIKMHEKNFKNSTSMANLVTLIAMKLPERESK